MKFEEKCSMSLEKKNEEKDKNYAYMLKRRNRDEQESKRNKCIRDVFPRRSSNTSRYQISFIHYEGNNIREGCDHLRNEFKKTLSQRESLASRYQSFFLGYCFNCNNFGHKVVYCRSYGRNVQARYVYVLPHNIECYKFHNHGHITHDFRSMMKYPLKENSDIRYKKV
jgi:hypothetical protein